MTANKDAAKTTKFLHLFEKLRDWSDDNPEGLTDLASKDEGLKNLCLELLRAAGDLQQYERLNRDMEIGV